MQPELQDFLAAWCGEELPAERQKELLFRLRQDPAFRAAVVEEIRMLGMLRAVQSPEPRWLSLADELGETKDPAENTFTAFESQISQRIDVMRPSFVSSWWRPAALAACAALAVMGGIFLRSFVQGTGWPGRSPTVGVLVQSAGVVWANEKAQAPNVDDAVTAGPLSLKSGKLTLALLNGVTVNMEGPAEVDLQTVSQIYCERGQIRANVPKGAEGFTVNTPGASIVDLGTEFVVDVGPAGRTLLTVVKGRTQASVRSTDGGSVREKIVSANSAVEIDPAKFQITDIAIPPHVLPAPDMPVPELRLANTYADAVRACRPRGYWRCDDIVDGLIHNDLAGQASLLVLGGVSNRTEGLDNKSVAFEDNNADTQVLLMGENWTPPSSGFAVEMWFASRAYNVSVLAGLHAADESMGQLALIELIARGTLPTDKPGGVRFLYRQPPVSQEGVNLYSQNIYLPYRWHHMVSQRIGDRLELYIDGKLAGQAKLDVRDTQASCQLMLGRLAIRSLNEDPDARPFVGRMDEIAIYDHPLKIDDIRRHAQLGMTSGS